MIYTLCGVLLLNVVFAFKLFRNILAPPVLLGAGMLGAAIVAALHYDAWRMDVMLYESVLLLGGSTLLFTLFCSIFRKTPEFVNGDSDRMMSMPMLRKKKLKKFYVVLIVLAVACFFLKMYCFMRFFGGFLNYSELIGAAKADTASGELRFHFPVYVTALAYIGRMSSFFTCWLLALSLLSKDSDKRLRLFLIVHIMLVVADGVTGGTKDAIFDPLFRLGVVYVFVYFAKRKSLYLSFKIVLGIILGIYLCVSGLKGLSEVIGRSGVDNRESSDMFAEYMGAEIKNFDIYMHGYAFAPKSIYPGQATFQRFYTEIFPNFKITPGTFQDIGGYHLGNVYTQVYSFHKDFGVTGVIIMNFIIAFVAMLFYNRALLTLKSPQKLNLFLFIYSSASLCLFMAFFSSRFTENIFTLMFIRRIIALYIFILMFKHFFFVKPYKVTVNKR